MPPLIIQTEHLDETAVAWIAERAELVRCAPEDERFEALLARADALVVRTYTKIDPALLDLAPKLKVVGRAGVGLDNFDLDACRERSVRVVSTPDANTRAVVELVFAFLLDLSRPRRAIENAIDLGAWKELRAGMIATRQLSDMTLGIVGLGRIGSQIARAAKGFDMRVVYHDIREIPEAERAGAIPVDERTLWAESDAITIHIDGRSSNRHAVGASQFVQMKDEAILINASRGFVLDHDALASFLREHPNAQAALDVHDPEPIEGSNPLIGVPNAVLTPHIAAATRTAHANMSRVVEDVWRVLQGEEPRFPTV